jgi:hypothetical protein
LIFIKGFISEHIRALNAKRICQRLKLKGGRWPLSTGLEGYGLEERPKD